MEFAEKDRLAWEVRKLQDECSPWYRKGDKWESMTVAVIAVAGFV